MNETTSAAGLRLDDEERLERYRLLREAIAPPEPPVITEAGVQLLVQASTRAQRPTELDEPLRSDLDKLARTGLIGPDGLLNPAARDVAEAVRQPDVQLVIEVAAGQSMRSFKAWLGYRRAVILAQPSPAITAADTPRDVADRTPLTCGEYVLDAVLPGWVPVAAARWLGLGPRQSPAGQCRLPLPDLARRIADPDVPVPADDPLLARIWGEPVQLCAISVQPAEENVLLIDAARAGLWLLSAEDDSTGVLTALPSHSAWRLLLTLITGADRAQRKASI